MDSIMFILAVVVLVLSMLKLILSIAWRGDIKTYRTDKSYKSLFENRS